MVAARPHDGADVVEEGGRLEEEALPLPEAVLGPQGVEEGQAEGGDMGRVGLVVVELPPQGGGAGRHLPAHLRLVLGVGPAGDG